MAISLPSAELASQKLATATALPAHFYSGSEMNTVDQVAVFNRHWQYVCHQSQMAELGDYVVAVLGQLPIILVQTEQGMIRVTSSTVSVRPC